MYTSIVELSLALGFLMILRLFIFYKKSGANTLMLALAIFFLWFAALIIFLNVTGLIFHFPFLIRTGFIPAYLIGPFLFIYIRNSFYPGIIWKKTDWLFLLPALVYVIDMFPFLVKSSAFKIAYYQITLNNPPKYFNVEEGWIAISGFHYIFVYCWNLILEFLQFRMIYRNRNIEKQAVDSVNGPLFWFLVIITICFLPLTLPGTLGILMRPKWFTMNYVGISEATALLATTIYLFFYPDILLGFGPRPAVEDMISRQGAANSIATKEIIKEENPTASAPKGFINRNDFLEIVSKLEKYIADKTPFLDQRYSIHDLAGDVDIPVYQLSPIINQYYNDNFNSWINKFRVNHFIMLWEQKANRDLTIDALARKSGFSNRTTFINAFKKEKNTTPTMYLKK